MGDIQTCYPRPVWKIVERRLQDSIDVVEKFVQKNGFKFFTSKTSMLHFTRLSSPPQIELRIGNIRNQKSLTMKYLGLVLDSQLDWKSHIQQSKCNYYKALNLMRIMSSTEWVADQTPFL